MARIYGKRWEGIGNDLGEGGQAHVLRVRDRTGVLLGEFALKRISNPKRAGRFASEVEAIKRLDHPNIVKLVDHSALEANPEETEKQYIVMPLAAGGDLSKVVGRYQGDLDKVLIVARQIAEGLKAAHDKKIVHRDVKPENILFENDGDHVWVSDFGICLIADQSIRHTEPGEVVGPVVFMAPELEGGGQLDVTADADIYSLGKVIYYMLTGGVRLPRENLDEEKYAAVLAGPGLEDLRLLLTQMICPRPARIKDIATVIGRLEQIQRRRQGGQIGLSAEGSAALDRLKASIAENEIKLRQEQDAVRKTEDLLDAVQRGLIACLKAQLELAAAEIHTPGALKAEVREAPVPAQRTLMGRASKSLILEGLELTCQKGTSPHARIFALQFFVYRKTVVSLGGAEPKAGVIVRLELREADGRPVSGCAAYVRREAIGRNQYKYSVTDNAPLTVECEPRQWGDQMDALKQFVLETVSAFPKMIEGDVQRFTLMRLRRKK